MLFKIAKALGRLLFYVAIYTIGISTGYIYSEKVNAGGCGTASFINNSGYLVTARHVVGNQTKTVFIYKKAIYLGTVVYTNRFQDIAFVKSEALNTGYLQFTPSFTSGLILVLGYPLPDKFGYDLKGTYGTAHNDFVMQAGRNSIVFNAISYPGNSGGPIVELGHGVVGILTNGKSAEDLNHGEGAHSGYGTTASAVVTAANEAGITIYISPAPSSQSLNTVFKEAKSKELVVNICTAE